MKDLFNNLKLTTILAAAVYNSLQTSTVVDMNGYQSVLFVVGTNTVTDGTYAVTIEGSDDNVTFTPVTEAYWLQGETGVALPILSTDDNKTFKLGYLGSKRYLRLKLTPTGATTGGSFYILAIQGSPRHAPVA